MEDFNFFKSYASFSVCGKYRWNLRRQLGKSDRKLIFIGLNPSIANSDRNDATLIRLMRFAQMWGYGCLEVVNLFARIAKNPILLSRCKDPVGFRNNLELHKKIKNWSIDRSSDLWLGWGVKGQYLHRNVEVMKIVERFYIERLSFFPNAAKPYSIGSTKGGHPKHPLYSSNKDVLMPFEFKN